MRLDECRMNMRDMLDELGLAARGWVFVFDKAERRLGQCRYGKKQIGLSRYYVEGNSWETVRQTALHECAHALVGPGQGHGPAWKAQARALGVRAPRSAGTSAVSTPPKVIGTCPECGKEYPRLRMKRDAACGQHGGYDTRYRLTWRHVR